MQVTSLSINENGQVFEAIAVRLDNGETIVVSPDGEVARYGTDNKFIGVLIDEAAVKDLVTRAGAITA